MAAFATTVPVKEFNVDTFGIGWPAGQVLKNDSPPCGTTVKFNEYAAAVAGIPHEPGSVKDRWVAAAIVGGPKAPVNPDPVLVSATRQGFTG